MKRRRRRSRDLCLPFCPAAKKPRSLRFPPPLPPPRTSSSTLKVLASPPPPRRPAVPPPTLRLYKMGNLNSISCLPKPRKSSAKARRRPVFEPSPAPSPGLSALAREDGGWYGDPYVVNRRSGDARRAVLGAMVCKDFDAGGLELDLRLAEEEASRGKQPHEDLSELFSPLTDEEEDMVSAAMHHRNRSKVLVIHEASNIEITGEILQCLNYSGWLNDEVINVYLELLKERENREPNKFLKCHFFNTFFYKKLISEKTGYDFKSVRRWTSQKKLGYGLVECDKIFVPIHKGTHWCLAVIDVKDESFQYLDSLGGMDSRVLQALVTYFRDEANDKSNRQIDTMSWKQETISDLPLQTNGWDCGMFMLKYIDFYSRGLSLSFTQEHMMYFRNRIAKEILLLRAE